MTDPSSPTCATSTWPCPTSTTQLDFYTDTWGLTERAHRQRPGVPGGGGLPGAVHRPAAARPTDKRIDLISFGVAIAGRRRRARREARRRRGQAGQRTRLILQTPGGGYGFRFFDNEGRTVEISADVEIRQHRAIEEGESIPVRISHVVINRPTPSATRDFYDEAPRLPALGHALQPAHGRDDALHADATTGTTAWPSPAARTRRVHHVSFEMRGLDEYMRGTGRAAARRASRRSGARAGTWPATTPSPTSSTRSGNTMEYTTELELIDDGHLAPAPLRLRRARGVQDQWGTANPMNEFVARESFNDPDKGVFVAPPV